MHQRSAASGRPSGTDGSDFSYRMVVDSRYTKVASTKSVLRKLFLFQAVHLLVVLVLQGFLSTIEDSGSHGLDVATAAFGLISLLLGELGRRRSRAGLLRFFMLVSSIAVLFWIYSSVRRISKLGTAGSLSHLEQQFEIPVVVSALLGLLFQIFILAYTARLILNMTPPKRAS